MAIDLKLKRYYIEKLREAEEIVLLAFPSEHEPERFIALTGEVFKQISEHEHYVSQKLNNLPETKGGAV